MSEPDSKYYNDNPLWGIGVTKGSNGEMITYGYPWKGLDPELFSPDMECVSNQEVFNHELSIKFKKQCLKTKELFLEKKKLKQENEKLKDIIKDAHDRLSGTNGWTNNVVQDVMLKLRDFIGGMNG